MNQSPELDEWFGLSAPDEIRKIEHIHAAAVISDLGTISGNRLEVLAGDRPRICFRGIEPDAFEVEIVACH